MINIKIDATRKKLNSNTFHLIQEGNEWRTFHGLVSDSLKLRRKRWKNFRQGVLLKMQSLREETVTPENPIRLFDTDMGDVEHIVKDFMQDLDIYYSTTALIQMKQAELDRVSVKGMYVELLHALHQGEHQVIRGGS